MLNRTPLPPQKIMVIGATSFIAQAALRQWAKPGATLVLVARDEAKLQAVAQDCSVRGAKVQPFALPDFSNLTPQIADVIAQVWAEYQGLDGVLIAHGDLPDQAKVQNDPLAIVQQTMVNGTSVAVWLSLLAPRFEAQAGGWMAAISSVAANRGRAKMYVYGAAKALVSHHLSGLRQRLQASGVRVIDFRPGPILTPMTADLGKMPLMTTPEAIAPKLVKSCGHGRVGANGTIYLPGIWFFVMTGLENIPEFMWKKMKI